ncbi:hypothetical protein DFH11DRAFT_1598156 [Phellopilus nigrolimitatus]|nr:hypothetical protein DFH11DRAFT_1598156 [Phellopilus nigrolimitatus]
MKIIDPNHPTTFGAVIATTVTLTNAYPTPAETPQRQKVGLVLKVSENVGTEHNVNTIHILDDSLPYGIRFVKDPGDGTAPAPAPSEATNGATVGGHGQDGATTISPVNGYAAAKVTPTISTAVISGNCPFCGAPIVHISNYDHGQGQINRTLSHLPNGTSYQPQSGLGASGHDQTETDRQTPPGFPMDVDEGTASEVVNGDVDMDVDTEEGMANAGPFPPSAN